MAKIDIFGDKKHIFEMENLPEEFENENGKYKLSRGSVGFSYLLVEPSAKTLAEMNDTNQKEKERKDKLKEQANIINDLIARVEALEKKT